MIVLSFLIVVGGFLFFEGIIGARTSFPQHYEEDPSSPRQPLAQRDPISKEIVLSSVVLTSAITHQDITQQPLCSRVPGAASPIDEGRSATGGSGRGAPAHTIVQIDPLAPVGAPRGSVGVDHDHGHDQFRRGHDQLRRDPGHDHGPPTVAPAGASSPAEERVPARPAVLANDDDRRGAECGARQLRTTRGPPRTPFLARAALTALRSACCRRSSAASRSEGGTCSCPSPIEGPISLRIRAWQLPAKLLVFRSWKKIADLRRDTKQAVLLRAASDKTTFDITHMLFLRQLQVRALRCGISPSVCSPPGDLERMFSCRAIYSSTGSSCSTLFLGCQALPSLDGEQCEVLAMGWISPMEVQETTSREARCRTECGGIERRVRERSRVLWREASLGRVETRRGAYSSVLPLVGVETRRSRTVASRRGRIAECARRVADFHKTVKKNCLNVWTECLNSVSLVDGRPPDATATRGAARQIDQTQRLSPPRHDLSRPPATSTGTRRGLVSPPAETNTPKKSSPVLHDEDRPQKTENKDGFSLCMRVNYVEFESRWAEWWEFHKDLLAERRTLLELRASTINQNHVEASSGSLRNSRSFLSSKPVLGEARRSFSASGELRVANHASLRGQQRLSPRASPSSSSSSTPELARASPSSSSSSTRELEKDHPTAQFRPEDLYTSSRSMLCDFAHDDKRRRRAARLPSWPSDGFFGDVLFSGAFDSHDMGPTLGQLRETMAIDIGRHTRSSKCRCCAQYRFVVDGVPLQPADYAKTSPQFFRNWSPSAEKPRLFVSLERVPCRRMLVLTTYELEQLIDAAKLALGLDHLDQHHEHYHTTSSYSTRGAAQEGRLGGALWRLFLQPLAVLEIGVMVVPLSVSALQVLELSRHREYVGQWAEYWTSAAADGEQNIGTGGGDVGRETHNHPAPHREQFVPGGAPDDYAPPAARPSTWPLECGIHRRREEASREHETTTTPSLVGFRSSKWVVEVVPRGSGRGGGPPSDNQTDSFGAPGVSETPRGYPYYPAAGVPASGAHHLEEQVHDPMTNIPAGVAALCALTETVCSAVPFPSGRTVEPRCARTSSSYHGKYGKPRPTFPGCGHLASNTTFHRPVIVAEQAFNQPVVVADAEQVVGGSVLVSDVASRTRSRLDEEDGGYGDADADGWGEAELNPDRVVPSERQQVLSGGLNSSPSSSEFRTSTRRDVLVVPSEARQLQPPFSTRISSETRSGRPQRRRDRDRPNEDEDFVTFRAARHELQAKESEMIRQGVFRDTELAFSVSEAEEQLRRRHAKTAERAYLEIQQEYPTASRSTSWGTIMQDGGQLRGENPQRSTTSSMSISKEQRVEVQKQIDMWVGVQRKVCGARWGSCFADWAEEDHADRAAEQEEVEAGAKKVLASTPRRAGEVHLTSRRRGVDETESSASPAVEEVFPAAPRKQTALHQGVTGSRVRPDATRSACEARQEVLMQRGSNADKEVIDLDSYSASAPLRPRPSITKNHGASENRLFARTASSQKNRPRCPHVNLFECTLGTNGGIVQTAVWHDFGDRSPTDFAEKFARKVLFAGREDEIEEMGCSAVSEGGRFLQNSPNARWYAEHTLVSQGVARSHRHGGQLFSIFPELGSVDVFAPQHEGDGKHPTNSYRGKGKQISPEERGAYAEIELAEVDFERLVRRIADWFEQRDRW